jgi:hypothetical protein
MAKSNKSNQRYTVTKHDEDEKLKWWVHDSLTSTVIEKCRFRREGARLAAKRNALSQRAQLLQALVPCFGSYFSVTDRVTGEPVEVDTFTMNGSMLMLGIDVVKLGGAVNSPGTVPAAV